MDSEMIWDILEFPDFEYYPARSDMNEYGPGSLSQAQTGWAIHKKLLNTWVWQSLLGNTQNHGHVYNPIGTRISNVNLFSRCVVVKQALFKENFSFHDNFI